MNDKQIKQKTDELVVTIRQYILGLQKPIMVKNALNCLFVDIFLDTIKKAEGTRFEEDYKNGCFNKLLEEW